MQIYFDNKVVLLTIGHHPNISSCMVLFFGNEGHNDIQLHYCMLWYRSLLLLCHFQLALGVYSLPLKKNYKMYQVHVDIY